MQFRKTSKILLMLSLVLVFSLMLTSVSFAQDDGLSDDELALIDRVSNVVNSPDEYESFVVTVNSIETSSQSLGMGGVALLDGTSSLTLDAQATVIRGENPNGWATIFASVENIDDQGTVAYDLEAEARYVDGVLYLNITNITGGEGLPAPDAPVGWQVVDFMHPFYTDLDLASFEELFVEDSEDMDDMEDDSFDIEELINTLAASVTLEESDIDGTPVDVITITIGQEAFNSLLAEQMGAEDDPVQAALVEMMLASIGTGDGDLVSYSVALGEDDTVLGVATNISFELAELDLSEAGDDFAGMSLGMTMQQFEVLEYSQINETFEPVEAPE